MDFPSFRRQNPQQVLLRNHQKIPLFRIHDDACKRALVDATMRVIESRWYILGAEVAAFERDFAAYCGVAHCVGVANGTDALELALRALGVKRGHTVFLAANAGFYGSTAVRLTGAVPYYVDVDEETLTLSPRSLEHAFRQDNPKAVIITHLYGQLADIQDIVEIATRKGVPTIEDCAQAHGASRGGRRAGSFGTVGCFSFYPTKNLGALGDGGAVTTNDPAVAAHLLQLRQYGWSMKYRVDTPGGRNSRLDEMQAALLREKLGMLDGWNGERRRIGNRYNQAFARLPVRCPISLGEDFVAHLYVVRHVERDALRSHLEGCGIGTDIHYPVPDHLQKGYASHQSEGDLPITEDACRTVLSLPCFPGLADTEQKRVISALESFFEGRSGAC
jgi:dTDP-4-amino-4,6-dideoxygalactose transaminase